MKINQIVESGTTAGSIATVAKPLGELQVRGSKPEKAPKVTKGKKYANTISEGAIKRLAYDLLHMDADEFQKVYKQAKEFFKKPDAVTSPKPSPANTKTGSKPWHDTGYVDKKAARQADEPIQEDELKEDDLIIMPGMIRNKDKSFIAKSADRRDHEVEMARSDVYAAAKDAMRIFNILENRTEDEGLMGWQQSYITLAADYLNSVADSLEYDTVANENVVGKLITKLAQRSAKDLPKTPEVQRAIANHAIKMEKNVDNAVKAGTAAAGAVAGKAVYDKGKEKSNEGAGVIAGGMSNFEESRPYNPLDDERREQAAMDADRRRFKHDELSAELSGEEEAIRRANEGPWYVRIDGKLVRDKNKDPYVFNTLEAARKAAQTMMKKDWNKGKQFTMTRSMTENTTVVEGSKRMSAAVKLQRAFDREKAASDASRKRGQEELDKARKEYDKKQADGKNKKDVTEEKCNECGGIAYADESIAEEKDACYNKVKSRYKVWPSAYASGALVKCRKVGASNWGNKSKK